ncbi:MAG TPA: SH3 domain-containing protein [Thermomicrobiales bacterium]|nr:SH3 domain-containing protein [Thermomicrobiales bacterium]
MRTLSTLNRRAFLHRAGALTGGGAIAIAGFSAISPTTGFAQSASAGIAFEPGDQVDVITDSLNLRSDASISASVVGTYPNGTVATVTGSPVSADGFDWYPVTVVSDGASGWFAGLYIDKSVAGSHGNGFTVVDGPVNLRASYGLSSQVISMYQTGWTGYAFPSEPVNADGYTWAFVQMNDGTRGWLATDFVAFDPATGDPTGENFTVSAGPLNLRQEPSLSAPILGSYPVGARGFGDESSETAADGYDWINVKLAAANGDPVRGWFALNSITLD